MKITSIKSQLKRTGHYFIFIDGNYSFSLGGDQLLEQKLYTGQDLDPTKVKALTKISSDDKLYNLTLRYVAMRPRSEWELITYLKLKNSPAPLTHRILNKLTKLGLNDDLAFARSWVNSRRLLKPLSRRKIYQELVAKHVAGTVINQVMAEDETDELTVLRELVTKKRRQSRYQDKLKLMRYLSSKGFAYDNIKLVVDEIE